MLWVCTTILLASIRVSALRDLQLRSLGAPLGSDVDTTGIGGDDGGDILNPTHEGPNLPCQNARRITPWHYKLDYDAAVGVDHSGQYLLKAKADCSGPGITTVILLPHIDPLQPLQSSSAELLFESRQDPFIVPAWVYVCPMPSLQTTSSERQLEQAEEQKDWCLAVIVRPDSPWRPHRLLLHLPFGENSWKIALKEMDADSDKITLLALDALTGQLALLVAMLIFLVVHFLVITLCLRPSSPKISFKRRPEDAVLVQSPWSDLRNGILQVLAFIFSVITLQGIVMHLAKHASDAVMIVVIFWPCTFGMAGVLRMFQTLGQAQLAHAALAHGICVRGAMWTLLYDIVMAIGFAVLALCLFCSLASSLSRNALLTALGTAIGFYVGPTVTMAKALMSSRSTDKAVRVADSVVSLPGLSKLLKAGAIDEPRAQDESPSFAAGRVDLKLRDGKLRFLSLRSLLGRCRESGDGSGILEEANEVEENDAAEEEASQCTSAFGFRDYRRHGHVIYQLSGCYAGYANVPLMVICLLALTAVTVCRGMNYLATSPELLELSTTNGRLVPSFQPRQQHYAVMLDKLWANVAMFVRADPDTTLRLNYTVPSRLPVGEETTVKLINVELAGAPFPHTAVVTVTGQRGTTRSYVVHFLPARTLATSLQVRTGNASRCMPWSSVPGAQISVPDDAGSEEVQVQVALTDYMLRVPVPWKRRSLTAVSTVWHSIDTSLRHEPVTASDCNEVCRYDPSCLDSIHGLNGCYFAYSPFDEQNCHLAHTGHSGYGRRHWLQRTASGRLEVSQRSGGAKPLEATADELWRLNFPPHLPEWSDSRSEFVFRLALAHGDQELDTEVETLHLYRGTQQPRRVLVSAYSESLVRTPYKQAAEDGTDIVNRHVPMSMEVDEDKLQSHILLTLSEYDVTKVGDTFTLFVVPLISDTAFEVEFSNSEDAELVNLAHYGETDGAAWVPFFRECGQDPLLRRYDVCGGSWNTTVLQFEVNSWLPSRTEIHFRLVGKGAIRDHFKPYSITLGLQGVRGQAPAEWMVRKKCMLRGDKAMGLDLLTVPVTCAAVQNCESVNFTGILASAAIPYGPAGLLQTALWKFGAIDNRDAAKLLLCSYALKSSTRLLGWAHCTECGDLPCLCMKPWSMNNRHPVRLPMRVLVEESGQHDGHFVYHFCRNYWKVFSDHGVKFRLVKPPPLQLWDDVLSAAVHGGHKEVVMGLSSCLRKARDSPLRNLTSSSVPEAVRMAIARGRSDLIDPLLEAWTGFMSSPFRKELMILAVRSHCKECLNAKAIQPHHFRMFSFEEDLPEVSQAETFAEALKMMPELRSLVVAFGWLLPEKGAMAVVQALRHLGRLEFLSAPFGLFNGMLMQHMCEALAGMFHLTTLRLDKSQITDDGAKQLAAVLKDLPELIKVDLSGNRIGREGAQALIDALATSRIFTELDLTENKGLSLEDQRALQGNCTQCSFDLASIDDAAEWDAYWEHTGLRPDGEEAD